LQRARVHLGTLVSIKVCGVGDKEAHRLINAGFNEIKKVHELMSFHDRSSDVSRLNHFR